MSGSRSLTPGALAGLVGLVLAGCTGALQDRVARQDAALADLQTTLAALRGDVQGLRDEIGGLRAALGQRDAAEALAGQSRDAMAGRLASAERRVEEVADGLAGLETSVSSLAEQFARLETGNGTVSRPGHARPRQGPPISPEELFDRGMESFRAGELGQAVLDFEEFADKNPTHPLAASAQFWIGEAYFRSRDFEQAASKYQKAIELSATGERTPDALLRLGLALRSLHREDRAREVWARLLRDFPDSDAALRARTVLRQPGRAVRPAEPR